MNNYRDSLKRLRELAVQASMRMALMSAWGSEIGVKRLEGMQEELDNLLRDVSHLLEARNHQITSPDLAMPPRTYRTACEGISSLIFEFSWMGDMLDLTNWKSFYVEYSALAEAAREEVNKALLQLDSVQSQTTVDRFITTLELYELVKPHGKATNKSTVNGWTKQAGFPPAINANAREKSYPWNCVRVFVLSDKGFDIGSNIL